MPFDAITSRPFMRAATSELALLADQPGADLRAILAELQHRERKPARRLAESLAARLTDQPASICQPAPEVPFEIVPCQHGEVVPEARETVVEVARVPATDFTGTDNATVRRIAEGHASMATAAEGLRPDMAAAHRAWEEQARAELDKRAAAKPAKPAKAPKRDKRPGDIGWNPPSLNTVIKRAGNPSHMWPAEMHGAFGNPLKAARVEALKAEGWQHDGERDGYMVFRRGQGAVRVGHHGMIYLGDATWVQLAKDERDRLADAGRPILARLARIAAAEDALKAAKARRAHLVKHFVKHRAAAKGAEWAKTALLNAKGEARATWKALRKARAELAAARAS